MSAIALARLMSTRQSVLDLRPMFNWPPAKQMSLVDALLFSGVREVKQEHFGGSSLPVKMIYDGTESYWEEAPRQGRWHGKAWHPVEPILGGWRWDWVEVWVPAKVDDNEYLSDSRSQADELARDHTSPG
jgi:hypothetical protein